ncbi:MAG: hypothetical protein Q9181_002307 [Wetmoreana brouardii]
MPCMQHPSEEQSALKQEEPQLQLASAHQEDPAHPNPAHKAAPHHGKMSEDAQQALKIHNQARNDASHTSHHPRPDLVWDDQLVANATAYAKHLASANHGLQHTTSDQRPNQGENLYWSKPNGSLANASKGWVDEKKNYHGEKIGEGDFASWGHYTQCIWPTTTKVGVGMAKAADGGVYVVGRYSPPGNWGGKDAYNG